MLTSPPIFIADFKAFSAFVQSEESNHGSPVPDTVVNEPPTAATGWLYGERRDSIEVHRERMGLRYTPEERKLLQALRDVVSAGSQWAAADTRTVKPMARNTCTDIAADNGDLTSPPLTARIYKTRSQDPLYRSHLPVMAQLAVRVTAGNVAKASEGASSAPSGT
ncbi:MAG TPA: hypothetical protein VK519_12510 [Pinirhizobacter sp.]|uniref:hypothetical protein n=1 Tax=Pinirhizobacter sp. TaxID=2950432 RepID=UPI002BB8B7FA|nr:hypothetical protein [Pinirhizobacter sp.]HMH68727.1 hypothetical protein [Pinirhizobacter sp.]